MRHCFLDNFHAAKAFMFNLAYLLNVQHIPQRKACAVVADMKSLPLKLRHKPCLVSVPSHYMEHQEEFDQMTLVRMEVLL